MNRIEAERRMAAIAGFRDEQKRLEATGLLKLDRETARAIRACHDDVLADLGEAFDFTVREPPVHLGMRLAATAGALALVGIGLAVLDLVWGSLAVALRMVVAIAVPALLALLAEAMSRAGSSRYAIGLVAALAALALLGETRLLAATLNQPFGPSAFLLCGLFAAALGHRHRSRVLAGAGLVLAGGAAAVLLATLDGRPAQAILWRAEPLLAAGLAVFAVGTVAERKVAPLAPAWRLAGLLTAGAALLLLAREGSSLLPVEPGLLAGIWQLLGPLLLLGALLAGVLRDWRETAWAGLGLLTVWLLAWLHGRYGASLPVSGQVLIGLAVVLAFASAARLLRAALARGEGRPA